MTQPFKRLPVYGALAAGLLAFGFAPILVRLGSDTSPFVLVTFRTLFAALFLLPYWMVNRSREAKRSARGTEYLQIAIAGISLGLHFTCWLASLYYTSVASASVLVTIHPILVIVVERFFMGRQFAATTWAGVVLAFAGSIVLGITDSQATETFSNPLFGNMLAFAAAAIFVIYLFIGQRIRQKREWIDYVFPVYTVAAVTCLLLTLAIGDSLTNITSTAIWVSIGLALGPQILGHGSMNYAVKFISPTLLSTLILVEPLLASILAFFIFAELPPVASLTAMGIIVTGVGFTWKRKKM